MSLFDLAKGVKPPVKIMVGTAIGPNSNSYPVLCDKCGCKIYGDIVTAAKAAKGHGERAHPNRYAIEYSENAKVALANAAAMNKV